MEDTKGTGDGGLKVLRAAARRPSVACTVRGPATPAPFDMRLLRAVSQACGSDIAFLVGAAWVRAWSTAPPGSQALGSITALSARLTVDPDRGPRLPGDSLSLESRLERCRGDLADDDDLDVDLDLDLDLPDRDLDLGLRERL